MKPIDTAIEPHAHTYGITVKPGLASCTHSTIDTNVAVIACAGKAMCETIRTLIITTVFDCLLFIAAHIKTPQNRLGGCSATKQVDRGSMFRKYFSCGFFERAAVKLTLIKLYQT